MRRVVLAKEEEEGIPPCFCKHIIRSNQASALRAGKAQLWVRCRMRKSICSEVAVFSRARPTGMLPYFVIVQWWNQIGVDDRVASNGNNPAWIMSTNRIDLRWLCTPASSSRTCKDTFLAKFVRGCRRRCCCYCCIPIVVVVSTVVHISLLDGYINRRRWCMDTNSFQSSDDVIDCWSFVVVLDMNIITLPVAVMTMRSSNSFCDLSTAWGCCFSDMITIGSLCCVYHRTILEYTMVPCNILFAFPTPTSSAHLPSIHHRECMTV
jgi:hypothetical protein